MTAPVIPISPYLTLGKMGEQLDRLFAYGRYYNNETVMQFAARLKQLQDELSGQITEQQFKASIELIGRSPEGMRRRSPDAHLGGMEP